MSAVIIVGSAPSAIRVQSENLEGVTRVAINNAWRLREDFDFVVCPNDLPADRRPPSSYGAKIIGPENYMAGFNAAGGIVYGGATMAFAAGYWAAHALRPSVIGFFACDMVYSRVNGTTHFYGVGSADPLRGDFTLQDLEAKSVRLFCFGLSCRTLIVNCSDHAESRLLLPRIPLHRIRDGAAALFKQAEQDAIEDAAKDIFDEERSAPFDVLTEQYWTLADGVAATLAATNKKWRDLASASTLFPTASGR